MQAYKKITIILILLNLPILSSAQVLFNNGAQIQATGGAYIYVNGSVRNAAAGQMNIDETAGTPAEMFVSQNITNDATLLGDGHIRLLGNWYNNNIFTSTTGTVFFEGANQLLSGSVPTHFFNITLDGSGYKTQQINQYANGVLNLKHIELRTETFAFFMLNTATNAIIRTSGFVSSLNGGFLSRNTNTSAMYLFPVGSSVGIQRYRPVELSPQAAAANTYTVRLANLNAGIEGYNTNSIEPNICEVNPLFYHQIDRTNGSAAVNMSIFFDAAADGDWEGISKWQTPVNQWNIIAGSTSTPGAPLSFASTSAWNDFSNRPYILHRSNVAPTFNTYGPYCTGETPPSLPSVSLNGIAGTWSPATINTSTAGTTTYTFTPNAGVCGFVYTTDITVNPSPSVNLGSNQNICINNTPFTLDAGPGMTSYLWSTGGNTQTISASAGGNYSVTVTNSYGCTATDEVTVTVNPLPVVSITGLATQYCLNSGPVPLTGTPPGGSFSGTGVSGSNFNPSTAGVGTHTITYTYTDGNSCTNSITAQTEVTPNPELSIASLVDPSCYGYSDGSINLTTSGGLPGYIYTWNPATGTNGPMANNLLAGTYNITVEDIYGCEDNISVVLTNPDPIDITIAINNHVQCYGESNGSVVASVSGGTGPYIYTWNDPGVTHQPYNNNLPAGTWTLTVEDANGCSMSEQVTITQPNVLDVQFVNVDDVSCFGLSVGSATALVVGGTAPYLYEWDDPGHSNAPTISGLPMGTYNVTITDANNCTLTDFIHITQPDPLEVTTTSQPVQCGTSLGSVSAQVTGGTLPYSYLWTGGYTSQQVPGLTSGTYRLTVTDAHGCSTESVVYVGMQGNGIVVITEDQSITCFGQTDAILTASMLNGVSPMEYNWSNSGTTATIQNLAAGIYSVTVTDSWGCSGTQSHMVTEPTEIHLAFATTPVTCFGGSDGTAAVSVTGGIAPYTYSWSNGSSQNTASGLSAGNYVVTIHDAHYCEIIGNVIVTQPENPVTLNMVVGNISCFGMHDGYVNLFVTGGVPPYTYLWQIGENTTNVPNIDNLYEGIYNLHVEDANHCVNDTSVAVSQPAPLSATWISQGPSCIGNNDGYIELTVTGGTAPYSFTWGTGTSPVEYISGLVEGQYLITILDSMACEAEVGPITIIDVQEDCIRIPNAFTPNADGVNDTWIIDNIDMYPRAYIEVFNRWGQCIFEAKGSEDPWDGTYNGKIVPTGPYIYVVNLFNGDEAYTGIVTVVK